MSNGDNAVQSAVDKMSRVRACTSEVNAVLAKYQCRFDPEISIKSTGINLSVKIIPLVEVPTLVKHS